MILSTGRGKGLVLLLQYFIKQCVLRLPEMLPGCDTLRGTGRGVCLVPLPDDLLLAVSVATAAHSDTFMTADKLFNLDLGLYFLAAESVIGHQRLHIFYICCVYMI